MPTPRGRVTPVLLAALLLVGGANLGAYAATGGPLLLGQNNAAGKTTALKKTGAGPALKLTSRPSSPSLSVSSGAKVPRLNADRVDGLEGSALRNSVHTYSLPALTDVTGMEQDLPGLPAGRYLASYVVAATTSNTTGRMRCGLEGFAGGSELFSTGAVVQAMANLVGVAASGYVEVPAGALLHLDCFYETSGTFSTTGPDNLPSEVTFVRVDDVVKRASTPRP